MSWCPKKCVIVPVDFSPASDNAVRTALSLVEKPQHVHVIHVAVVPDYIPYGEAVWVVDAAGWAEKASLHLGKYVASHPEFCGLTFETLSGEVAAGIVKYASDHAAELIVMPTHGLRGIKRFLLGSVTQKVLAHAPCEVLVQRFPG